MLRFCSIRHFSTTLCIAHHVSLLYSVSRVLIFVCCLCSHHRSVAKPLPLPFVCCALSLLVCTASVCSLILCMTRDFVPCWLMILPLCALRLSPNQCVPLQAPLLELSVSISNQIRTPRPVSSPPLACWSHELTLIRVDPLTDSCCSPFAHLCQCYSSRHTTCLFKVSKTNPSRTWI
jgi:hypothetical protein